MCRRRDITSAVSWPSRVIQMSKSLCLKPNPFLDEPNKANLAPDIEGGEKKTSINKHKWVNLTKKQISSSKTTESHWSNELHIKQIMF